jgi:hypothetical protein
MQCAHVIGKTFASVLSVEAGLLEMTTQLLGSRFPERGRDPLSS